MAVKDKKLEREINLANLLKSDARVEWEAEHKVCYGIYDDDGLEVLNTIDEINVKTLDDITRAVHRYQLRARFNSHRNPIVYVVWLHKNSLHLLNQVFEKDDYKRAKAIVIKHGHKC